MNNKYRMSDETFDRSKLWRIKDPAKRFAALAAHSDGRKEVSAQWLFDNPDEQGYMYRYELDEFNTDPWIVITGADALVDGSKIILEYGSTAEKLVDPAYPVYIHDGSES